MISLNINKIKRFLFVVMQRLEIYHQRSRSRKLLLELDEHLLKDIGITQQQALQEGRLHFWQGDDDMLINHHEDKLETNEEVLIKLDQNNLKKAY